MLEELDYRILQYLQGDLPLTSRPFGPLAEELGVAEEVIVQRIKELKHQQVVRRLAAILRHQNAGFSTNAMVAWRVDSKRADQVGQQLAQSPNVSHCYLREVPESFAYNLFTMLHARSEEELQRQVQRMSAQVQIAHYLILDSVQEYKKTSMRYI